MSSRSSVVLTWSLNFALGFAYLAQHSYWLGVSWLGLGVISLARGIKATNLDDLSANTLGLNTTPRPKSPFSANRIFVSLSAPN